MDENLNNADNDNQIIVDNKKNADNQKKEMFFSLHMDSQSLHL